MKAIKFNRSKLSCSDLHKFLGSAFFLLYFQIHESRILRRIKEVKKVLKKNKQRSDSQKNLKRETVK